MAFEKRWAPVPVSPLIADGTTGGQLQVTDAFSLKVRQSLLLKSGTQPTIIVQVVSVTSPTVFFVGRPDRDLNDRVDVSAYLVADGASISNPDANQQRPALGNEEYMRAVYEEEPVVALRTHIVDRGGRSIGSDPNSPFYIRLTDGSVNIGTVNAELEVALSHMADTPNPGDIPDSVRIGDGVEEWQMNEDQEGIVHDQDTHDRLDFIAEVLQTEFDATQSLLQTEFDQTQTAIQNLQTEVDAGQYTMNEAFNKAQASGGQLDDVATTAATEDNVAPVRITPQRAQHVNLRNQAGTEVGTASAPVRIDPTGTTPQPVVGNVANAVADSGNPIKVGGVYRATTPTFTDGQRADQQLDRHGAVLVNVEGRKRTYSACIPVLTVAAATTDFFTITGANGTVVRVENVSLTGEATSNQVPEIILLKRSTANTGGTSSTITAVPHDSLDAAAAATVRAYTANPATLGTLVGNMRAYDVFMSGGNANPPQILDIEFNEKNGKSPRLNSANEVLALNLGGVTITGLNFAINITWTEES